MIDKTNCGCSPCPGRGNDGHGMTHCAECCFGTGVIADLDCPVHGQTAHDCDNCPDCLHNGQRCCGCYDGACCQRAACTCYPFGFTPDSYEGPQEDCPAHGRRSCDPPNRQVERLPDPVVPTYAWCETCLIHVPVIDEFDDQIGYEERAREVRVTALDCGHDIANERRKSC